jgi:2-keto-3-deoxy-L-rhamnonate aldolase RhmA
MFEPIRQFRRKLKAGQLCLGVSITLSDPVVTEVLGRHADFLWLDLEHTPMGLESLQGHLIAARAVSVAALVRVPASEEWMIKRVLDMGAGGVIVPQVRSAGEVKRVVETCRYKPQGNRGYGPRRASNYGADPAYLETINQDLFVCVQIENVEALAELDQIVQVPGLDSVALGPFDLAASMGYMRHPEQPEVVAAIERVIETARARGLWVGMGGPAEEEYALRAVRQGVQWLQSGTDFEYLSQFITPFFRRVLDRLGKEA